MTLTPKHLIPFLLASLLFTPALPALVHVRPILIEPPPAPNPPPGYACRWVEPVYRTVRDLIWIGEREQQVEDMVEIAPGTWKRCLHIVTIPAHFENVARTELVSAGYWELVRLEPLPQPRPILSTPPTVGVDGYSHPPTEDLSKFSGLSEWPDSK